MGSSGALPNFPGNVNVGGLLTAGDLTVTDDATVGDDLAVTGDATVGGTLALTPGATMTLGADVNLYRSGANVLATDDAMTVGGNLRSFGEILADTGGTSINAVNRAATNNFAAYVLRTAGTDRWSLQMVNNATNDVQLTDSGQGTVALLAETRATAPNLSLLTSTKSYGGGVGVIYVPNASTNPTTDPAGGGLLYINAGALTYRGSAGTVTAIAPA